MRSSVTSASPRRLASPATGRRRGRPLDGDGSPAQALGGAEKGLQDLRPAGAEQPEDAEDLTAADGEADIAHGGPPAAAASRHLEREPFDPQRGTRRRWPRHDIMLQKLAADHQADQLAAAEVADRQAAHAAAVAQHGDPRGKLEHLIQAMRDVDDGHALARELSDDLEQVVALGRRQGRGGLVHDQNAGIQRERLGDLDQLLLADAQACDLARGIRGEPEPRAESARRGEQPPAIDEQARDQRLAAEKDVLGDAELGHEAQLLVDDGDAAAPPRRGCRRSARKGHRA